jgi:hypothetical protein
MKVKDSELNLACILTKYTNSVLMFKVLALFPTYLNINLKFI